MKKSILTLILILLIVLIILIAFKFISGLWKPLPEDKRNISTSNVKMLVNLDYGRTAIVRTYKKEEFDKFSENEINKIKAIVDGNIEGDIPELLIKDGVGAFEVSFVMIDKIGKSIIEADIVPDKTPKIKMTLLETIYSKDELKEIEDSLKVDSAKEGIYSYEVKKYFNNEELLSVEEDEPYRLSMFIEISYEINNEAYVSIFAINTRESY